MNCPICNHPMIPTTLEDTEALHHSCDQCLKFSCYTTPDETILRFYMYLKQFGIRSHHQTGWVVRIQDKSGKWTKISSGENQPISTEEAWNKLQRYSQLKAFL